MNAFLAIMGAVVAVMVAAAMAVVRDLATSGARGAMLARCERLLERASALLPAEDADDVLAEMLADLRQRFAERGPIAAYWWARSAARQAIPAIAGDLGQEAPAAERLDRWALAAAVIAACGTSVFVLNGLTLLAVKLVVLGHGLEQQLIASSISVVILGLAVLSGSTLATLIDWPGGLGAMMGQRHARRYVVAAVGSFVLGIAVLVALALFRKGRDRRRMGPHGERGLCLAHDGRAVLPPRKPHIARCRACHGVLPARARGDELRPPPAAHRYPLAPPTGVRLLGSCGLGRRRGRSRLGCRCADRC
jgi:hypothetical protein